MKLNHATSYSSFLAFLAHRASFGIFDRAGFGTVTFRRDSMAATLFAVQNDDR